MNDQETQRLYDAVAKAIARARKAHQPSLTQAELAGRTDSLSRSAIANIESFRQRVALHQLVEIADALDLPLSHLLQETLSRSEHGGLQLDDEVARTFLADQDFSWSQEIDEN